jgi:hypothetical protein
LRPCTAPPSGAPGRFPTCHQSRSSWSGCRPDGIAVVDRDHYSRITLADELARARAGDPTVRGRLDDLTAIAAAPDKPDRYLLQLDSHGGDLTHTAIAHRKPDIADHAATYVPGTGWRASKMGADMNRVDADVPATPGSAMTPP